MNYAAIRNDTRKQDVKITRSAGNQYHIFDTVTGNLIGRALRTNRKGWVIFAGQAVERFGLGQPWTEPKYRDHVGTLAAIPARIAYYGACQRNATRN